MNRREKESLSVYREVLEEVGKIEMRVGQEVVGYEVKTESILASLQSVLENDFPGIYKLKRTLAKLTENMDTARAKLTQASRHSMSTAIGGKIDSCKDELDESQQKVEQCRVSFSANPDVSC